MRYDDGYLDYIVVSMLNFRVVFYRRCVVFKKVVTQLRVPRKRWRGLWKGPVAWNWVLKCYTIILNKVPQWYHKDMNCIDMLSSLHIHPETIRLPALTQFQESDMKRDGTDIHMGVLMQSERVGSIRIATYAHSGQRVELEMMAENEVFCQTFQNSTRSFQS